MIPGSAVEGMQGIVVPVPLSYSSEKSVTVMLLIVWERRTLAGDVVPAGAEAQAGIWWWESARSAVRG